MHPRPVRSSFSFRERRPGRLFFFFFLMIRPPPISTLFPSPTLSRSRFDLECDSQPVTDIDNAGVFSRALQHRRSFCWQSPQVNTRALIAAVLAPHHAENPELRRSEEHTSELQSPCNLVCRLLLEKKK